jgi:uncharacterized protein
MTVVYIAAASGEEAQARGLAEALGGLGLTAAGGAPAEGELAKLAEESKAVVVLWSKGPAAEPWLGVLAAMALDRKKLINTELKADATPAPFKGAPKIDLSPRDRTKFKTQFEALLAELGKLNDAKPDGEAKPDEAKPDEKALPEALVKARAALLAQPEKPGSKQWRTLAAFAAGVAALFVVGYGTGRLISAVRAGEFLVTTPAADAAPTSASLETPQQGPQITTADLERRTWREIASDFDEADAARIKAAARRGDALSQTLACIGHMAGAPGFLPSPSAAREQCDAASAQENPAALYFSWVLRREAPHAGLDEATARGRLQQASRLGWTPAQVDYAQSLPNDRESQAEAGRLFLAAAEHGDARGQFYYARWLRDSIAGPRDPAAAIPYLDRAAQNGQLEATHMLATLYRDGTGVPRNEGRAKALYEQAARGHHPPSMFNLADMLRGGTAADRARAVALYSELACMRDERQIQPMASARLRALHESAACR